MTEQKAREESRRRYVDRYSPSLTGGAVRNARREAFERGATWERARVVAAPSDTEPDTEAQISAVTIAIQVHALGENWGDDGVAFVGCDCGEWFGKSTEDGWDRARRHVARMALNVSRLTPVQPVQVEPEGCEHCKSCGSRMWAGQLIRRNDSGRAVEHQNCDHPYHPAAEPVQVEVTTAEELDALDALPVGTVVGFVGGSAHREYAGSMLLWISTDGGRDQYARTLAHRRGALTVLRRPAALGGGE